MCICGGIGEAAIAASLLGGFAMRKKLRLAVPPLVELVGKVRKGVRPGQVFRDKRRQAKVNERVSLKQEAS